MRATGPVTYPTVPAGASNEATMGLLSRAKMTQSAGGIRPDVPPLPRSRPPPGGRQAVALRGGRAVDRQHRRAAAQARPGRAGVFPAMHEAVPLEGLAPWDKLIDACRHHIGMLFSCLRSRNRGGNRVKQSKEGWQAVQNNPNKFAGDRIGAARLWWRHAQLHLPARRGPAP